MKLKKGDKIKDIRQGIGTIIGKADEVGLYPIKFDEKFELGHTCSGLCKDGYGRWIHEEHLKPIKEGEIK